MKFVLNIGVNTQRFNNEIDIPNLTVNHVPNLTLYDPNLTGVPNVPKIEQYQYYHGIF